MITDYVFKIPNYILRTFIKRLRYNEFFQSQLIINVVLLYDIISVLSHVFSLEGRWDAGTILVKNESEDDFVTKIDIVIKELN